MKCIIEKCSEDASMTVPYNGAMLPVCGVNHYMVYVEREAQEYVMTIDKQRREGRKNKVVAFRTRSTLPIAK